MKLKMNFNEVTKAVFPVSHDFDFQIGNSCVLKEFSIEIVGVLGPTGTLFSIPRTFKYMGDKCYNYKCG